MNNNDIHNLQPVLTPQPAQEWRVVLEDIVIGNVTLVMIVLITLCVTHHIAF